MTGEPPNDPGPKARTSLLRRLKILPLFAVGVGIVYLLARDLEGGPDGLGATVRRAHPGGLLAALAALALAVVLGAARFRAVLHALGHPITFARAASVMLSAWPLALFAPSKANDLLRAHALRREIPPLTTVASVLAERVVDLEALSVLSAVGAARAGEWRLAAVSSLAAVGLLAVVLGLLRAGERLAPRFGRFEEKVTRLVAAARTLLAAPGRLAQVTAWSFAAWIANVAILYALTVAFDAGLALGDAFALWPLALFAGLLPVTFGGLGTRDAAFVFLVGAFAQHPSPKSALLASSLGYAVLSNAVLALVGLPFMALYLLREQRAREEA